MFKKLIVAGLAFSFVLSFVWTNVAVAQTATTSVAVNAYLAQLTILRQLQQGMSGEDVKLLQTILATQSDVYPEGIITGFYGPLTSKAVRKYQEKFGIAQAGRVGPQTMKKINELLKYNVQDSVVITTVPVGSTTPIVEGCVSVPPGHLIAPGWLKKNNKVSPTVATISACQKLPPGIAKKLGIPPTIPPAGTTTPPVIPPVVDIIAPIISSLISSSTNATTTRISWMTNELATTKVTFGTTSPVLSSGATTTPVIVSGYLLSHSIDLGNLSTSTTYYYVVESADVLGNTATSSQAAFVTPAL